MTPRPSPITALVTAAAAFVVCLAFGSETYMRHVVFEYRSSPSVSAVFQTLAAPAYSQFGSGFDSNGPGRFTFVVLFPVLLGLLVIAITRGGNGFLAGWIAAVGAGSAAGFARGIVVGYGNDYGPTGGRLGAGLTFAGYGANFGLVLGWAFGLLVLVLMVVTKKPGTVGDGGAPILPVPPGGWPSAPVPGDRAWAPSGSGDRPPPPPAPSSPGADPSSSSWPARPEPSEPSSPSSATTPWPGSDSGSSGWARPDDQAGPVS